MQGFAKVALREPLRLRRWLLEKTAPLFSRRGSLASRRELMGDFCEALEIYGERITHFFRKPFHAGCSWLSDIVALDDVLFYLSMVLRKAVDAQRINIY
jgi:hypothetical protein